jgi:hypothetical protein
MAVSGITVRCTEVVQEFLAGVTPVGLLGANFTYSEVGQMGDRICFGQVDR